MKALTLWQPWASLVGRGKHHETRSWSTRYRGLIAIHAALRKPVTNELPQQEMQVINSILGDAWPSDVPLGAILAVVELTDCTRADRFVTDYVDQLLGDYSDGRWAWQLSKIFLLSEPLPFRGHQGLWNIPDDVEELLLIDYKNLKVENL